jgi:RNA polymerase sigma factor (sigma-70 family)
MRDLIHIPGVLESISRAINIVCSKAFPDAQDRDDAKQECWLAALGALDSLRNPNKTFSWAWVIARRTCGKLQKVLRHASAFASHLDDNSLAALAVTPPGDEDMAIQISLLKHLVAELAEPARSVLLAHDYLGMGFEEVASALGMSLRTAKRRAREGRDAVVTAYAARMRTPLGIDLAHLVPVAATECELCGDFAAVSRSLAALRVINPPPRSY